MDGPAAKMQCAVCGVECEFSYSRWCDECMGTPTNRLHERTDLATVRRPFNREVGGFELDKADLAGHPAACPDDVTGRLRSAALQLGLSIQVGARRRLSARRTWERYIVVTDERLPKAFQVQTTTLRDDETWVNAARRIGLWPTS